MRERRSGSTPTPACTGTPLASGTAAKFASPGLTVAVADNSTTTFHATAQNANGTSSCSTASVTYAEVTATPPDPPESPTGLSMSPLSGGDDNEPKVGGTAPDGTTVKVYTDAACTGTPVATGTAAEFASPGLTVSVARRLDHDLPRNRRERERDLALLHELRHLRGGHRRRQEHRSAHDAPARDDTPRTTPPATTPTTQAATGRRAAATRKCKKLKGSARSACLKKAKRLPV